MLDKPSSCRRTGRAGQGEGRHTKQGMANPGNDKSKKIHGFVIDLSVKGVVSAKQQGMNVPVNSSSVA